MVKDEHKFGNTRFRTFTKWDEGFGVDNYTIEIGMIDQNLIRKVIIGNDYP